MGSQFLTPRGTHLSHLFSVLQNTEALIRFRVVACRDFKECGEPTPPHLLILVYKYFYYNYETIHLTIDLYNF